MSARATKKLNKFAKKPAMRAAAKERPKRSTGQHPVVSSSKRTVTSGKAGAPISKSAKGATGTGGKPSAVPKHRTDRPTGHPPLRSKSTGGDKSGRAPEKLREVPRKAAQSSRTPDKKSKEAARKSELLLRQRETKLRAEQKRKATDQKKKDADRLKAQKAKLAKLKQREVERKAAQKVKEAEAKRKEAEKLRLALEQQKKREAEQKAAELEKARIAAERQAAKEQQKRAADEEKERRQREREAAKLAKEQERAQQKALREAEREEARRQKEEERAKREAERESYRKAKEAEREKIRAAKEAARRALEGRIAEATRNANKLGGGRSSTTRIYSPRAIPDQSGTTRRVNPPISHNSPSPAPFPAEIEPAAIDSTPPAELATQADSPPLPSPASPSSAVGSEAPSPTTENAPALDEESAKGTERTIPIPDNVEDRYRIIEERLKAAPDGFHRDYKETIDMSWIHHDSALEGVVYTFQELKTAIDSSAPAVTDTSLQPVIEEIRRHKQAIELVRDLGERKRAPITVDTIKKIYVTLHPEEGDIKTVKYRRDIPQHRLYFHEYAHPEKIPHKVRQVVDWLNGPEPKKLKSPIRVAARVHYELLRVFPFQTDSGKVARLVMNLMLLRAGHPPAIIHSTERQRYYEALKGALPVLVQMVTESIMNALASIEKLLDDHDIRIRS